MFEEKDAPELGEMGSLMLRWKFWFFVALSAGLIIVVVYYLPLRFAYQSQVTGMTHDDGHMHDDSSEHMADDGHHDDEHNSAGSPQSMMDEMMHGEDGGHTGHEAQYHEENDITNGVVVVSDFSPAPITTKQAATMVFRPSLLSRGAQYSSIPYSSLDIQHEKLMHVIGVRKDLTNFFHIHPDAILDRPTQDFTFTSIHNFAEPGDYKIWSEVKYKGETHVVGHPIVTVGGGEPKYVNEKDLGISVIIDDFKVGDYRVALFYDQIQTGENRLAFALKSLGGDPIGYDPFLGEAMHLAVISEDLKQFIHTHPEPIDSTQEATEEHDESLPHTHSFLDVEEAYAHGPINEEGIVAEGENMVQFSVTLPDTQYYKVFAQFRPKGVVMPPDEFLLAEFWIRAGLKGTPPPALPKEKVAAGPWSAAWTQKLIISFLLIAALSLGVKKFITVEPVTKS